MTEQGLLFLLHFVDRRTPGPPGRYPCRRRAPPPPRGCARGPSAGASATASSRLSCVGVFSVPGVQPDDGVPRERLTREPDSSTACRPACTAAAGSSVPVMAVLLQAARTVSSDLHRTSTVSCGVCHCLFSAVTRRSFSVLRVYVARATLFDHSAHFHPFSSSLQPAQVARLRVRDLAEVLHRRVERAVLGPRLGRALLAEAVEKAGRAAAQVLGVGGAQLAQAGEAIEGVSPRDEVRTSTVRSGARTPMHGCARP